jgi:putative membrane protein
VHAHTVSGPISASLGALDVGDASDFFNELSETAVAAAAADRSHRWRSGA